MTERPRNAAACGLAGRCRAASPSPGEAARAGPDSDGLPACRGAAAPLHAAVQDVTFTSTPRLSRSGCRPGDVLTRWAPAGGLRRVRTESAAGAQAARQPRRCRRRRRLRVPSQPSSSFSTRSPAGRSHCRTVRLARRHKRPCGVAINTLVDLIPGKFQVFNPQPTGRLPRPRRPRRLSL